MIQLNLKITPKQLKAAITKTKVLLLNTPSNPTGSVYSKESYSTWWSFKGTDIIVFSDEMYEKNYV